MSGDIDRVLAVAEARVQELAEQAVTRVGEVMADVGRQLDEVKAEVRARTGLDVDIPWAPAPPVPAPMDLSMAQLADMAQRCRHLLAAAELLRAHVKPESAVTVGQLAKTRLPQRKSERVLEHLRQSGFFVDEGEVSCGG